MREREEGRNCKEGRKKEIKKKGIGISELGGEFCVALMSVHLSAQSSNCIPLRTIQPLLPSSTEDRCCCTTETYLCSFHNLPHVFFPHQLSESNCIPLFYLHDLLQAFASSYQDGFFFSDSADFLLIYHNIAKKNSTGVHISCLLKCMRELFITVTIRQSQTVAKMFSKSSIHTYFSFSMQEEMKSPT